MNHKEEKKNISSLMTHLYHFSHRQHLFYKSMHLTLNRFSSMIILSQCISVIVIRGIIQISFLFFYLFNLNVHIGDTSPSRWGNSLKYHCFISVPSDIFLVNIVTILEQFYICIVLCCAVSVHFFLCFFF